MYLGWFVSDFVLPEERHPAGVWVAAAIGLGVNGLVVARVITRRPPDCSSPATLARSYRSRLFMRWAFGLVAPLVGFNGEALAES